MSEHVILDEAAGAAEEVKALVIRKALLADVKPLVKLINEYASQGIMLPRTEFELAENVRDFTVAVVGEEVAGCGALHFYGLRTGEIRSLAVHPRHQNLGIGKRLTEALEAEGIVHGLVSVFAFTYIPSFFARLGFVEVDRQQLPAKVWKDCLRCPKLQCCDEIAMHKRIAPQEPSTPFCGEDAGGEPGANGVFIVPAVRKSGPTL